MSDAEKLQIIEDFILPVQVYVFLDIVIVENLQFILGKKRKKCYYSENKFYLTQIGNKIAVQGTENVKREQNASTDQPVAKKLTTLRLYEKQMKRDFRKKSTRFCSILERKCFMP